MDNLLKEFKEYATNRNRERHDLSSSTGGIIWYPYFDGEYGTFIFIRAWMVFSIDDMAEFFECSKSTIYNTKKRINKENPKIKLI